MIQQEKAYRVERDGGHQQPTPTRALGREEGSERGWERNVNGSAAASHCGSIITTNGDGKGKVVARNGTSSGGYPPHSSTANGGHHQASHNSPPLDPNNLPPTESSSSSDHSTVTEATAAALHVPSTTLPASLSSSRLPAFSSDDGPPLVMEARVMESLRWSSVSASASSAWTATTTTDPTRTRTSRRGGSSGTWGSAETGERTSESMTPTTRTQFHWVPRLPVGVLPDAEDSYWYWLLLSLFVETVVPQLTLAAAAVLPSRVAINLSSLSLSGSRRGGHAQALLQQQRHPNARHSDSVSVSLPLGQSVKGLPNYGQTCFLNSVLQALASLPSFEVYLHKIVTVQHVARHGRTGLDGNDNDDVGSSPSKKDSDGLCQHVLDTIWSINGGCCAQIHAAMTRLDHHVQAHGGWPPLWDAKPVHRRADPRTLLRRVGSKHAQFASKSPLASAATREQQDAQEFWQALLGMVVDDADVSKLGPVLSGVMGSATTPLSAVGAADEAIADDSDEHLTLAAALRLQRRNEEDDGGNQGLSTVLVDRAYKSELPNGFHDEKKLEDGSSGSSSDLELYGDDEKHYKGIAHVEGAFETMNHVPYASNPPPSLGSGRRMVDAISSVSPSPFSGWIGSVLQCRECRHVKPIRNHLFVDLPVVPTGVSSYLHRRAQDPRLGGRDPSSFSKHRSPDQCPPCTLEQCLEDYTSVERVHDVECRSCTHAREVEALDDEVRMLEQGILALEKKNPKSNRSSSSQDVQDLAKPLRDELEQVRKRLDALRLTSPDDEGAMERILSLEQSQLADFGGREADPPKIQLKRTDAFKCLMLTRLPAVLCIHVQRRFYDPLTLRASKTAQHVIFPEILDVGPYCVYAGSSVNGPAGNASAARTSSIPYRLMSVIEHTGGAFYGHYVTYRRDPSSPTGNQWLYISDDTVRRVDWNIVRRCQAYMLFYEAFV